VPPGKFCFIHTACLMISHLNTPYEPISEHSAENLLQSHFKTPLVL